MRTLIFAVIFLYSCLFGQSAKLPSTWGTCKRSDTKNLSECLRKNMEFVIRSMNKPVPELGLATFDPLDISEMYIGEGKGPVNVAQHFKNVKLYGISNVKMLKGELDYENKQVKSSSINPELRLEGDYSMKGQVLLLPIVGEGKANITMVNMKVDHVLTLKETERNGKIYWIPINYTSSLNPEKVIFKFDNLFNGQKDLGDNINKVLNDNQAAVFADVREGYEKSFALVCLDLAKRIFPKIPINEIFLD